MSDIIVMENETPPPPSGSSAPAPGAGSSPGPKLTKGGADASKTLAGLPIDLGMIADPVVKQAMTVLLNLVERQAAEIAALREENQRLQDENHRLQGEQGKPNLQPGRKGGDISSEKERGSRTDPKSEKPRGSKLDKIEVQRRETCRVAREGLPADAVFKGYESVIVQDLEVAPARREPPPEKPRGYPSLRHHDQHCAHGQKTRR